MNRRTFLKTGAGVTAGASLAPAAESTSPTAKPGKAVASARADTPPILVSHTAVEHRRRLENIALARLSIRQCLRTHLVTSYLPGQCVYNLGEYPCRKPWDPGPWDEQELDKLQAHGIRLLQVHEEWNDSQRLFGSHKLDALNPAGFRRFVDMVHRRGMKLIVYVSAGYFQRTDPDFQAAWAAGRDLIEIYFDYAHCSPASPGWRAYLLPRLVRILEEYGVDGFYNDLGYLQPGKSPQSPARDEVLAFEETATNDGALADLLALIYAEVHRRGGVVKLHYGGARRPRTEAKIYDYLWVGEGGTNGDKLREATKNYPPYVVPCLDMSRAKIADENELYLHAIPYLQFPVLLAGRPFTGDRAMIPGIQYPPEEKCFWTRHNRAIWKHHQAHPEGPHSYGWWDSVPGRPEARPTHAQWLKHYLPLVEEGTWAWLEITDTDLVHGPLPKGVCVSAFANRELFLALANYDAGPVELTTRDAFVPVDEPATPPQKQWKLAGRSLRLLRRVA